MKMKIMTKTKVWLLAILSISFFVVSCEKDEDPPEEVNEAEVLVKYMEDPGSASANYGNSALAIKSAEAVHTAMAAGKVYVIDIRSAGDFALGHIEDAVNLAPGAVAAHIDATDLSAYDEISLVCYSGQTASWLASLLRLAGYDNVYSMAFGMCAWADEFAISWPAAIDSDKSTMFVSTVTGKAAAGELPLLTTGLEIGVDILASRIAAVTAEGFVAAAISEADVYANLSNLYIINYWPNEEYLDPGHIDGAIQYTPNADLALEAYLNTLPTDKTIVVYCYSGQNSARIAAYLRVIGYDAKSLKFGANCMIYDDMTKSQWSAAAIKNYEYWSPAPTK